MPTGPWLHPIASSPAPVYQVLRSLASTQETPTGLYHSLLLDGPLLLELSLEALMQGL